MSVVGPRPHAVAHNELYRKLIRGYMIRHKVKPGITGLAQVNGWRGETDTVEKMKMRVALRPRVPAQLVAAARPADRAEDRAGRPQEKQCLLRHTSDILSLQLFAVGALPWQPFEPWNRILEALTCAAITLLAWIATDGRRPVLVVAAPWRSPSPRRRRRGSQTPWISSPARSPPS